MTQNLSAPSSAPHPASSPASAIATHPASPGAHSPAFIPRRAASWWTTLEDLQWSQKKIKDKIKRRAEGFAKAGIDTAINFGFHLRFDFSDYFHQLHGYFANVCDELHARDIKFMDHYSCNHVERPRGEAELRAMNKGQRHHVLLYYDPKAAPHAQYEGHFFNDICETDLRDGSRGYAKDYQLDVFCHNNPGFLDMHRKYLLRLMKEVPIDAIEVDDMCDYAGLTTCGCGYCRDRMKRDYGHDIPPFGKADYASPVFRDWLRMKSDSVAGHLKMIKATIGDIPLMTCCSNAGPIVLNAIALNLEKMAAWLDFFMLENVGINVKTVNWMPMDAEAQYQKDVARKKDNAPPVAISYTIFPRGGYLGWSLGRFWGVANWSSTLIGRLEEDPADAMEIQDIIGPYNHWESRNSDLDPIRGADLAEIRLVTSGDCRDNGWRGEDGREQWDRVLAWSDLLVRNSIGYRLLRSQELADAKALMAEHTPLILDGIACVSDYQFEALQAYLAKGGKAWLTLPYGTFDEKGFTRQEPLSDRLLAKRHKNLLIVDNPAAALEEAVASKQFAPLMRQVSGNPRWAARIRKYEETTVIHLLSTGLVAIPHPTIVESSGTPVLLDFHSDVQDNILEFELEPGSIDAGQWILQSPELGDKARPVAISPGKNDRMRLRFDLSGVETYAVIHRSI